MKFKFLFLLITSHFLIESAYGFNWETCKDLFFEPYLIGKGDVDILSSTQGTTILTDITIIPVAIAGFTSSTGKCSAMLEKSYSRKEIIIMEYLKANYSSLRIESSKGEGEYLEAFSSLFYCDENAIPEFKNIFQRNYKAFFPEDEIVNLKETYLIMNKKIYFSLGKRCSLYQSKD